jgi:very-short-patch-repair endonuclease
MAKNYDFASELSRERARELRQRMTRAEALLWQALRRKPWGIKFRRQHPIGAFVLDFYCAQARLGIEIDGPYHDNTEQVEDDASRSVAIVQRRGVDIVRFSNDEVLADLTSVLKAIRREVAVRAPSP